MLKGGLVVNASGPAQLHFRSENATVELWVDSISLQPFSEDEWKAHQDQTIEKVRKSKVIFRAVDPQGRPLANASISIRQLIGNFPFGCAINKNILPNPAYKSWFTSRFRLTVFENEMKWYSTETSPGKEDYSVADTLLRFATMNGAVVRGHNVLWDDPQYNPSWVQALSPGDLEAVATKRVNSIVTRYKGQLVHWDVVNENIHHNFFESKLGETASSVFYGQANQIDGKAIPFLNDYNTIEKKDDQTSSPPKYLAKIKEIRSQGYQGPLGIGLEGHFGAPDLAYVRTSIDLLASTKLPIWVTELDVSSQPNQATYLDQIIREVRGHPAIQGLLIWAAWSPQGCYRMCLTDNNFRNLPTGDVVDKIIKELKHEDLIGTTDDEGHFETSLYHGDYEAIISHPAMPSSSSSVGMKFNVAPTTNQATLDVKFSSISFS
ncbi:endo-1,4-beta-xylanase 5 [Coffea arabica]|uniref:Endo-1,4-beta-xylanase 5 n=1 Tax=Coffea arabica TaxID=13443 RepID=A0A6P6W2S5_COFAR